MAETKLKPEQAIDTRTFIGRISYDTATATGTVAETGVGFRPTLVTFKHAGIGTIRYSNGESDGTTNHCSYTPAYSTTTPTWQYEDSKCIVAMNNTDYATATCAMNDDGFTLSWTKTNSPTGTIIIHYIAYR